MSSTCTEAAGAQRGTPGSLGLFPSLQRGPELNPCFPDLEQSSHSHRVTLAVPSEGCVSWSARGAAALLEQSPCGHTDHHPSSWARQGTGQGTAVGHSTGGSAPVHPHSLLGKSSLPGTFGWHTGKVCPKSLAALCVQPSVPKPPIPCHLTSELRLPCAWQEQECPAVPTEPPQCHPWHTGTWRPRFVCPLC